LVFDKPGRAAVVDPGGDRDRSEQQVGRQNGKVETVLLTHGNIDRCAGAKTLAPNYGVPIEGPQEEERFWIEKLPMQSERCGFPAADSFEPDQWLNDGDTVRFGDEPLEVYPCPGHTPGHGVFFSRAPRIAIVCYVLFAGPTVRA
ncbi:MBL fold metallo-hydrolase, partial [Burkholderia cenocepacia]|uniref:MBL fold metallo-hydrolase n=1 Tax=Burkholderia cenocepacia TaxID=95486 RepID=UPI00406D3F85